ncbi:Beige/BEACH domain containing protein, putative [Entamoeba histolytica]
MIPIFIESLIKEFNYPKGNNDEYYNILLRCISFISKEYLALALFYFQKSEFITSFGEMTDKLIVLKSSKRIVLLNQLIDIGIIVFSFVEIPFIPIQIIRVRFDCIEETKVILLLFKSLLNNLNSKIINKICLNETMTKALELTIQTMNNIILNKDILIIIETYLQFLCLSCKTDSRILNIHIHSLFFNKLVKILLTCTNKLMNNENRYLNSIIASLQHLCFFGNGIESYQFQKIKKTKVSNPIRNVELPSVLMRLLDCPPLVLSVLQSLKIVLFSNSQNYTFLPAYMESICLMITSFNKEEIEYVFQMLEFLFITLQANPSNYLELLKPLINFNTISNTSLLIPLVNFITYLVGSNRATFQNVMSVFIPLFFQVLFESFNQYNEENEIINSLVKVICILLAGNKTNSITLINENNTMECLINVFNKKSHFRRVITLIIKEIVPLIPSDQLTLVLSFLFQDIIIDNDPLSRLKSSIEIMDQSVMSREIYGLSNNFELFTSFILKWRYNKINEDYKNTSLIFHRLLILQTCIDSYIIGMRECSANRDRLKASISNEFIDDFVIYNPWKEFDLSNIIAMILSLIIEQPVNKSLPLLTEKHLGISIVNCYLLPSLLNGMKLLDKNQRNCLFSNLLNSLNNAYSLYGTYVYDILSLLLTGFEDSLDGGILTELIQKIGRYAIKNNDCKYLLRKLKQGTNTSNLISLLSFISTGVTIGGLTFDTSDKVAYIKNYVWLDSFPMVLTGWLQLGPGFYKILEIKTMSNYGELTFFVKNGILDITCNTINCISVKVPVGVWFHFALCCDEISTVYINAKKVGKIIQNMDILQGSCSICLGHCGNVVSPGVFRIGEWMIINGLKTKSEIKAMYELGSQYKGRYCAHCYDDSRSLRGIGKVPFIQIDRQDLIYVMNDLINNISRTDLEIEGRVCPTSPSPFVECICKCGGISVLLSIIEKSTTTVELCDSLQILLFCLRGSSELYSEALKTHSFQILVLILYSKHNLISHGVLQVLLALSGIGTSYEDFSVTHPEILTTLALDFKIARSCPNGIEYILRILKSVYDFSPVSASESLRGGGLMSKLMYLFIDESTEISVFPYVTDLLTCILSINCNKEEVSTVMSFACYFLQVFDKIDSGTHLSFCSFRCSQLLTLLDQIVSVKGVLPGLSSYFIYQFINVSNPPESILPPLLHLAANLSFLSSTFCSEFYSGINQLLQVVSLLILSKESIKSLFSLLLKSSPNESQIVTSTIPDKKQFHWLYLHILFKMVHHSLLSEIQSIKIYNSCFIIETLTNILRQFYSLRGVITEEDNILYSLLSIMNNSNEEYIYSLNITKEQKGLCGDIVKLIGYICAATLRDGLNYQRVIIGAALIQKNKEFVKEIIKSTILHLKSLHSTINIHRLSELFVQFSENLIDLSTVSEIGISLNFCIESIFMLINIYEQHPELQTIEQNKIWIKMMDRMNILMFNYFEEQSFLFVAQHFHQQDFFLRQKHSEEFVPIMFWIIVQKIPKGTVNDITILYCGVLKRLVMNCMSAFDKFITQKELRDQIKSMLQMSTEDIVELIKNNHNTFSKLCERSEIMLKEFKEEQKKRKDEISFVVEEERKIIEKYQRTERKEGKEKKKNDEKRVAVISQYVKDKESIECMSDSLKMSVKVEWEKMKLKLIMPKGIWEEDVEEYMIDDIQSSFGIRRRIVRDYRFKERYESQIGEYGKIIKLPIIQKNYDIEVLTTPFGEEEEIYYCTQLYGLEEVESQIKIDEKKFILINYINTDHCDWIKIDWNDIVCIIKRRYLLQNNAIEILTCYGKSLFLIFEHKYDKIIKKFMKYKSESFDIIHEIEPPINLINKIGKVFNQIDEMTELWKKGELSNFNYLMYLNTKAGRSFNDLSQYPIFPWILNDYTSKTIDLNDEHIYRNFAYPIVAQTENKREKLQIKFQENGSHFGNHYSSLATTLVFLFRAEPYMKMHIQLFDGHFDTDRLFNSISKFFDNLSATPIELIPEFFFLPQFLINFNTIDFGKRKDNNVVNNVELPPWCNGNPRQFVNINMKALESPYVSQHLNEWIDLIFGYKQRGKNAEEACNVYPQCSYEIGDLSKMNEKERQTTLDKIRNFGQTPIQLFKTPHPKREVSCTKYNIGVFEQDKNYSLTVVNKSGFPIGEMLFDEKNEIIITRKGEIIIPNGSVQVGSGGIMRIERNGKIMNIEECQNGSILIGDERNVLVGGGDGSIQIIDISTDSPKKRGRLCGHDTAITCCVIDNNNNIIITGDQHGICLIWDIGTLMCLHVIEVGECVIGLDINNETGNFIVLTQHQLHYYDINGDLIGQSQSLEHEQFTSVVVTQTPMWNDKIFVVVGDMKGNVTFLQLTDNFEFILCQTIPSHPTPIESLKISNDNTSILIGHVNGIVICLN